MRSPTVHPSGLSEIGSSPSRCRSTRRSSSWRSDLASVLVAALVASGFQAPVASLYLSHQVRPRLKTLPIGYSLLLLAALRRGSPLASTQARRSAGMNRRPQPPMRFTGSVPSSARW
jgi:hypothetical protein